MNAPAPARLIIADDHPVVRIGVKALLSQVPEFQVVGEAADGRTALELVERLLPELLLLDLRMPNLPGLETLRELTQRPELEVRTILLTAEIDRRNLLEALQLGARGVLLKETVAVEVVECLRAVMRGEHWLNGRSVRNLVQVLRSLMAEEAEPPKNRFGLTAREISVVGYIVEGCTNKDIARECGIAEETVKRHLKNIFDKTGVSSRLELAMFALNHSLVKDKEAAASAH
jgi:DNA-binding NarL/FixJ family response regulator